MGRRSAVLLFSTLNRISRPIFLVVILGTRAPESDSLHSDQESLGRQSFCVHSAGAWFYSKLALASNRHVLMREQGIERQ